MTMSLQISTLTKIKDKSRELEKETERTLKCKISNKPMKKDPSTSCVCTICGQTFVCRRNLVVHMQKHNGKKPFECDICQKEFSRSDHLKNHVARHFKIGKHPCNQCEKIFKRADLLKYHKVNEHGSTISFKEIRSYTKNSTLTQERNSQCGVCGKLFLDEKGLKAHSKNHLTSTKHECNHCGKLFNQRSNLTVHVRQHTGTKPYKCETCGETFSTSCKLKTHMRKHTGDLLFVCDVCGKRFGEKHLLKMHMRIHQNFRAYVCSYCGKSFTHSSTLRSHVRIHTGAKPYKCDLCQESFAQISSLSYHRKSHLGEKPFVCDICGNKYTRRATLNAHRLRHTGDRRFLCSQCDFECDIANQLKKHMLHHHVVSKLPITSASDVPQNVGDTQLIGTLTAGDQLQKSSSEAMLTKSGVSCEVFSPIHDHSDHLSNRYQVNSESISLQAMATETLSNPSEGIIYKYKDDVHNYGYSNSHSRHVVSDNSNPSEGIIYKDVIHNYDSSSSHSRHVVSDPQALNSNGIFPYQPTMSYVMTSMEAPLKNGEPSTFPSDSIFLPMMIPKRSTSEVLPSKAQTQSPAYYASQALSLIHPTLPLKRGCDTDYAMSHPDVQSEDISQLDDPSCLKHPMLTSTAHIHRSVSEPSSSSFNPVLSKPNLHSVPSLLSQEYTSSLVESSCHSMYITKTVNKDCELSCAIENNLGLDPSQEESQSMLSLKRDMRQEMDDKRENHSGTSKFVNLPPVQYINSDKRKELPNENSSIAVNEPVPNNLPLDFSTLNKETAMVLNEETMLEPDKDESKPTGSFHVLSTSQETTTGTKSDISALEDSRLQSILPVSEDAYSGIEQHENSELASLFTFPSSLSKNSKKSFKHILNQISSVNHRKRKQKRPTHRPAPESKDEMKVQGQGENGYRDIHAAPDNLSQDESKVMSTYKCDICGKSFARRNNWNIHMQLHRGEKSFKCPICGKEFSRSHHMKDHLLLHSRTKELRCYHCLDEFSSTEQLEEHIQKAHNSAYPFKCNVCRFSCLELIQLKGHISQSHAEVNFSCQVCGLAFKTSISLKEHMKDHPGKNAFDCQQCGKSFIQNSCLILHIRKKHSKEKLFACGVCPDAFITASDLQRHLKSHTGDRPFACDQCKKVFADGKLLRRHSKIHLDERPYQCDHCPRRFKHRNTLCAHIRIHTGSKPYKCNVCGEAFTQSSSLAYHQQTHDRKKMYTCHICGKSYTRMATLNLHLLQHSGRSRFQCQHCVYKCNKSTAFRRHLEKCHGQETITSTKLENVHV